MKSFFQLLRATIFGGILFLVPGVVFAIILGKALAYSHKLVDPVAQHLPFESLIGLRTPMVLALALLLLFCLVAGLIARTALARRLVLGLEGGVLSKIPGYSLFKSAGESLLGLDQQEGAYPPVLVRLDDAWQIGLRVHGPENGLVTVFLPDAPNPVSGSVLFVTSDRVMPAGVSLASALKCLKQFGAGSEPLLDSIAAEESARISREEAGR